MRRSHSRSGIGDEASRPGTRTPGRFRERVLSQFRSPRNVRYLRRLLARRVVPGRLREFAVDTAEDAVHAYEQAEDLVYSDPLAQRGDLRPAAGFWPEVSRLNRAFFESRMRLLREEAPLIGGLKFGPQDDNEPYHYRMFVADSLRPPGMEHLNPGPLYAIEEDRAHRQLPPYRSYAAEHFRGAPPGGPRRSTGATPTPGVDPDDWGWDQGDPHRTAEQAMAEYWGEGVTESTRLGAQEVGGEAYGDHYAWGDRWRDNGGSRFMRYESVPFWQHTSRHLDTVDRDIEETLGSAARELDSQVRRWDMGRLRDPRGEEYRRYGPRSGHIASGAV